MEWNGRVRKNIIPQKKIQFGGSRKLIPRKHFNFDLLVAKINSAKINSLRVCRKEWMVVERKKGRGGFEKFVKG